MSDSILLRCLTSEDLSGADKLRQAAGWNQTLRDWQRFLSLDPAGCFAAVDGNEVVGTATTTSYGLDLAWIGMVLVDPTRRSQGIGRKLLLHCLDYLQKKHVRCIKLDATPAGQVLYEKLGFQVEWPLMRWERPANADQAELSSATNEHVEPMKPDDEAEIHRIDLEAFGVDRKELLAQLAKDSSTALVYRGTNRTIEGFGLLRPGINAHYIGPVVTHTEQAGLAILQKLLSTSADHRLFWDIPDSCMTARDWAQKQGFTQQRPLLRMFLGGNAAPGQPRQQWAISDPATG